MSAVRKSSLGKRLRVSRIAKTENGKLELLFLRENFCTVLSLIFLVYGIGLSIIYYELCFQNEYANNQLTVWIGIAVFNVFASLSLTLRARTAFEIYKRFDKRVWALSPSFRGLLGELAIVWLIQMPPFANPSFTTYNVWRKVEVVYRLNDILAILMLLRVGIAAEMAAQMTRYASVAVKKAMFAYGREVRLRFVVRCLTKTNPLKLLICGLTVSLAIATYSVRICEVRAGIAAGDASFTNYFTVLWMIVITVTTVGYGDYTPKTFPGRALCFALCIWGTFLISLIVIVLFESLSMNSDEEKVLRFFNKLGADTALRNAAAMYIIATWKAQRGRLSAAARDALQKDFHSKRLESEARAFTQTDGFFDRFSAKLDTFEESVNAFRTISAEEKAFKETIASIGSRKANFARGE